MFELTRRRRTLDIWPGFVDALGALLLVVIFILMVFTLSHFVLSDVLHGREQALERLSAQVAELADMLSLERTETARLRDTAGELEASLDRAESARTGLSHRLDDTVTKLRATRSRLASATSTASHLQADVARLGGMRNKLEGKVKTLGAALDESRTATNEQTELTARAEAKVELLNRQVAALRAQLAEIARALDIAHTDVARRDATIEELGRKLNVAMASKIRELALYRSDFFGRLRAALGDRPDIRIVGDRFVLQAELLFDTASAELGTDGRQQVQRLVHTLETVAAEIPPDIDWVLRIDGHTDKRPISTPRFPSNWELSTARALAIVKYMIALGIPPQRLAATGFGEFHPLDPANSERAYAQNRRIEIKLTSR